MTRQKGKASSMAQSKTRIHERQGKINEEAKDNAEPRDGSIIEKQSALDKTRSSHIPVAWVEVIRL